MCQQAQAAALAAAIEKTKLKKDTKSEVAVKVSAENSPEILKEWRIEFPDLPLAQRWVTPRKLTLLPASDAATHTVQLRLELPAGLALSPGMFARVSLPLGHSVNRQDQSETVKSARLYVPKTSVFKRAELSAVYIVNQQGHALLRQVRAGRIVGEEQEILSGVMAGERVALDPLAAAQMP